MTYGENIVPFCQDNTGTAETIENNVNLQFFTGKKFNPIFFDCFVAMVTSMSINPIF